MKEIPILFSTNMVQAILAGIKTITRRLVKWPTVPEWHDWDYEPNAVERPLNGSWWPVFNHKGFNKDVTGPVRCPYGQPGELLWVRESWQLKGWDFEDGMMTVKYATGETSQCFAPDPGEDSTWLLNKVEQLEKRGYINPDPDNEEIFVFTDKKQPFYPSIHMPKEAARIWLQVTDVRVERLQDISEEDAIAEGVKPAHCESTERCPSRLCKDGCTAKGEWWNYNQPNGEGFPAYSAKESFESLWQSINGSESWEANPWVWVVSFKVLSTTGKPDLQNLKAIE